jgi:transcriptional regulator with XRE-family HTH domain
MVIRLSPRAPAQPKQVRAENTRLLREIGYLVRNERAKRGITRRVLARQCQTSERYLAQIELGEANPSVLVLDAIARALDLDPIDLMPAGETDYIRRDVLGRLRRLSKDELAAVVRSTQRARPARRGSAYAASRWSACAAPASRRSGPRSPNDSAATSSSSTR